MSETIRLLAPDVANKIAAGEVVERPASVVKELLENAIDAKADQITVEIEEGGLATIIITDNGRGMSAQDAELALQRHATSKISLASDLFNIKTLGFRGEALPSIASVSDFQLLTRREEDLAGTEITFYDSKIEIAETAAAKGTRVLVKDLFYNTPARLKFMKTARTEGSHVLQVCVRLALAKPDVSIHCIRDGKIVLQTDGSGDLKNVIAAIYGKDIVKHLLPVDYSDGEYSLQGYIGKTTYPRNNRRDEHFIINGRYATAANIVHAAEEPYRMAMVARKYPFFVLNLNLPPADLDVNVHPAKTEVRFQDDRRVYSLVMRGVNSGLNPHLSNYSTAQETKVLQERPSFHGETLVQAKKEAFKVDLYEQFQPTQPKRIDPPEPEPKKKFSSVNEAWASLRKERAQQPQIPLAEDLQSSESFLPTLRPISQLAGTYILAQSIDCLYIFDQHAMAERIMYNQFKNEMDQGKIKSQLLLEPLSIEFSPQDFDRFKEKWEEISSLGFVFEEFGLNSFLVREVPQIEAFSLGKIDFKELFLELSNVQRSLSKSDLMLKKLVSMSCKASVKGNQWLPQQQMQVLIEQLG
ncbi:MAG: DNA mismatch repair endonuclease MutL, partial [Firmicutes bacterium]|nr:DNA mismatch repair endonuclease MutL [Bacillota bacterium]